MAGIQVMIKAYCSVMDETLDYAESFDTRERLMLIQYIPNYNKDITLRLLLCYQFNEFNVNQRDLFFNQTYQITNDRLSLLARRAY